MSGKPNNDNKNNQNTGKGSSNQGIFLNYLQIKFDNDKINNLK